MGRGLLLCQHIAVGRSVLYNLPIVRIFLEASLNNTAVDVSAAWLWAGITLASIVIALRFDYRQLICHSCAFHALYGLRMRILNHMGRLNLGFFTGGQSGAVQKTMNDNIEKMENIIAHDVSNLIGASLLLVSLSVLLFSINVPLALTMLPHWCLRLSFNFRLLRKTGAEDLDRSQPFLYRIGRSVFRVCVRDGRRKNLWNAGDRSFTAN